METLDIRPYARLLTMLSEQLIKNESVALTEIVKNAYDADSKLVKITFEGFSSKYVMQKNSRIIIEDRGCGMTEDVMKNDFINPASANKKLKKDSGKMTESGRKFQGEKGIGRFSLFKLGKKVTVFSKTIADIAARKLVFDFSNYPDEFIKEDGTQIPLEEITCDYYSIDDSCMFDQPLIPTSEKFHDEIGSGTQIIIEHLNDKWGESKINKLSEELNSLMGESIIDDFEVYIYQDNCFIPSRAIVLNEKKTLEKLLAYKSVYSYGGVFDEKNKRYKYAPLITEHDEVEDKYTFVRDLLREKTLMLDEVKQLSLFKDYFFEERNFSSLEDVVTSCGNFEFKFFIFDNDNPARNKYKMTSDEWRILKKNRVYIFRDNIRVFPYGSAKDDWLQVDTIRGTKRASAMFSNDQVVGYIYITFDGNPALADKTNREGILEIGTAFDDFVALNQIFLQFLKKEFDHDYKDKKAQIKKFDKQDLSDLNKEFEDILDRTKVDTSVNEQIKRIKKKVVEQNEYNLARIQIVENLAATGLSIEATNHDMHHFIRKLCNVLDSLRKKVASEINIDKNYVEENLERLRGIAADMESFAYDMKSLFSSSDQKVCSLRFAEVLDKVFKYYAFIFEQKKIDFEISNIGSCPLIVRMPEAQLVSILINILDNAQYWLEDYGSKEKKVKVTIDSTNGYVLISDNGPGIYEGEEEKIFKEFWTGKGLEGRGLGLYICRQFLERYDYSISVDKENSNNLSGANFLLNFTKVEEE